MMVRKSMRREVNAHALQMPEIALRMAAAGDGVIPYCLEMNRRGCLAGIEQIVEEVTGQVHRVLPGKGNAIVRYKFAQRFVCPLARLRDNQRLSCGRLQPGRMASCFI